MSLTETAPQRVDDTDHEGSAVMWLTFGLFLAQLGACIGIYLVLRSSRWSLPWKLAAVALPGVLVGTARIAPKDGATVQWGFWILWLAFLVCAFRVLGSAASRGSGQRELSWFTALPLAIILVALGSLPLARLHPIGSYDYRDDVLAAAHDADRAGEPYGVITESFDDSSDETTVATVKRLAGPGNARFVAIFDKLEAEVGGFETSKLSRQQLGTCYVFPVVTSRRDGIEGVTALSRHCTGPSEASSSTRLTDR
ncbi:hypothetical protein [Aeromicrobium sp. 9AM]|uniref:hypothetical protein n=1 Tax=Aeromicrobium sp. 9AM TaxID=2653126 RepID=UPI0012F46BBB|nr:hypothetical protein [Aeromicrobium sp. 9AM]VXB32405.1 conserved membrane hypothetical protein [Aeromicrobium sp. 9AM]